MTRIIVTCLVLFLVALTAHSQENESYPYPYKNSIVSGLFSFFVPGLGQFYNDEYAKGAAFLAVHIPVGFTVLATEHSESIVHNIAVTTTLVVMTTSCIDAIMSSKRINRKLRERLAIIPITSPTKLGTMISLRF